MISAEFIRKTGYGELKNLSSAISDVVIDSRKVSRGAMFVALPGEYTDGHHYIRHAFNSGAALCIVSKEWAADNDTSNHALWIVDSPEKALQILAKFWRLQFKIPVLAITGTNGKTTTRAMCTKVLQKKYHVHTTSGNLNNQLGLPLTLLKMTKNHDFSVLELGTNHFGEIAFLCELCQPTAGLITNIGHGHTEFFGSLEGVAKAKRELFDALAADSIAFINHDDALIRNMDPAARQISFAMDQKSADFRGKITGYDENACATLEVNDEIRIRLQIAGQAMAKNALAAVTIGKTYDICNKDITDALETFKPVSQRYAIIETDFGRIINDAYNANPDSTKAAVDTFSKTAVPGRRLVVFGDMFELGDLAKQSHAEIGDYIAESPIDLLFCYGPLTKTTHATANKSEALVSHHFLKKSELIDSLRKALKPGDSILVKGSRGNKLEEIIEGIVK